VRRREGGPGGQAAPVERAAGPAEAGEEAGFVGRQHGGTEGVSRGEDAIPGQKGKRRSQSPAIRPAGW
jgi:hypothetical protein